MNRYRALLAIAVVAAFAAVPLLSAVPDSEAISWNEGEYAAYYKVTDINDKAQFEKLVKITVVQKYIIGQDVEQNIKDITIKSVSNMTVESGIMKKVTSADSRTESFYTIKGTIEFDAKTQSNPFFLKYVLDKGELYDKLNPTIPGYSSGMPVTVKCTFEIRSCLIESGKYAEAKDCYVCVNSVTDHQTFACTSSVEADVNGTKVKYDIDFIDESSCTQTFTFDEPISKDKEAPYYCMNEVSTTVYNEENKITGTVDGTSYVQTRDLEQYKQYLKRNDGRHSGVSPDVTYHISPVVDFTDITRGFSTNDEAKTYIAGTLNGEMLENYSSVAEKAKSYERPSDSSGGDNTVIIIVGIVIAVIVIAAIVFFIFKKKSA